MNINIRTACSAAICLLSVAGTSVPTDSSSSPLFQTCDANTFVLRKGTIFRVSDMDFWMVWAIFNKIAGQINPIFHSNCAFSDASMKLGRNTHVGHLLQKSPLAT